MLKQLFKKLRKIPISIEVKNFSLLLYYSTNLHLIYFLKTKKNLIKFSLIFSNTQNKKKLFSEKMIVPEIKVVWTCTILEKIKILVLTMAKRLRI